LRVVSFLSYFFAGVFLTNSVPHLVIAVTGRRNRTPFGQNSSPFVNLLEAYPINVSHQLQASRPFSRC